MDINILTLFWLLSSIIICVTNFLMSRNTNVGLLGSYLRIFVLFGKLKQNDNTGNGMNSRSNVKRPLDDRNQPETGTNQHGNLTVAGMIPKRWFSHFYAAGALVHLTMLSCLIVVLLGNPLPYAIRKLIHWIHLGSNQSSLNNNAWPLLIVFCLEFLQILRRLYECLFISTFSKGTMSIAHYFYGIFLYSSIGIGLLSSMNLELLVFSYPGFAEILSYFLGVSIFFWSFYYQHKSMLTFASLRKKQKDHRPDDHYIPHGDLFEWVSCPHYLCEILIYLAFCLIFQFSNIYILSVAIFVLTNQVVCGVLVHKWYQQHFPSYPKLRAAVVPYIL